MNVFVGKSTEKTIAQNKDMLKHRDYKVITIIKYHYIIFYQIDLDGKLGKTVVVTKTTPQAQSGG
jgi:hypothetical protein